MTYRQKAKSFQQDHFKKPYECPHRPHHLKENDPSLYDIQSAVKLASSRGKLKGFAYNGERTMTSNSAPLLERISDDDRETMRAVTEPPQGLMDDSVEPLRDELSKINDSKFPRTPAHHRFPLSQLAGGRTPQEDKMMVEPSPDRVIWQTSPGDLISGKDAAMIELLRNGQKLPSSPQCRPRIRPVRLQDKSSPDPSNDLWKTYTIKHPLSTSTIPLCMSGRYSPPVAHSLPKSKRRRVCSNSEPIRREPQYSKLSALVRRAEKEYSRSKSAMINLCSPSTKEAQESPGKDFGNDFEGLDIEALDVLEMRATQAFQAQKGQLSPVMLGKRSRIFGSPQKQVNRDLKSPSLLARYVILEIRMGYFGKDDNPLYMQKILRVMNERSDVEKIIYLRGDWVGINARPGDIIHIIGQVNTSESFVADNSHNFVILNPDTLISSTVVADSYGCIRRAVLQDRVKATSDISKPLVFGSILHEIFQEAIQVNDFSTGFMTSVVQKLVMGHFQQLYILGLNPEAVKDELYEKMRLLQRWANKFVKAEPGHMASIVEHRGESQSKPTMCINKILDIEEHIWSPKYGLKGNIDVSIQMKLSHPGQPAKTIIAPLELKTGRNSKVLHHRAQTVLYTLMMTDRYDIDVLSGVLYYMETEETIRVPALRDEIRGMIIRRNELARYISDRVKLPPMLKDLRSCKRCYAADTCLTYHKALEDGTPESSGLHDWFSEKTSHITTLDTQFFKHWDDLLTKEESDMFKFQKELWSMTSSERENLGRCFSDMKIEGIEPSESDASRSKINRYQYRFVKRQGMTTTPRSSTFSFLNSQINMGEPIVVSDEAGHFALANGFVVDLHPEFIIVAVDRRLHNTRTRLPGFNKDHNQLFNGIIEIDGLSTPQISFDRSIGYRIDRDEFKNGMATVRNNLIQLMNGPEHRKRLLIHHIPPEFSSEKTQIPRTTQTGLNTDQKRAIEKVLSAKDYALILGMPGTGKTTTIAWIIRSIVAMGKSVLLTSYTHTAVDNILLKLKDDEEKILRLGASGKVHPDVRKFAILGDIEASTYDELEEVYFTPKIVAATCLSINHLIFTKRTFDYCIVDEASQIPLPVSLGPLRYSKTFVLVGDHYQLPPLVRNAEAQRGGLDVSLFKLLCETHPQSVVNLEHQYRMNKEIMALSNRLIYSGKLKVGDDSIGNKFLKIPKNGGLSLLHDSRINLCLGNQCWLKDLLDERKKVTFVDTDDVPAVEERKGDRITNYTEAHLVSQACISTLFNN
ncbi:DNA replication ATP-dependent helicase/nuclease dna2 [Neolecta irregularis DAH-3]|uniref:DNA replication ATP-dependent helicase/nuclease n=1 Tax=Neolecta irregularis (strain DAH-3) TaxID=1198029 RepID=A0A1U7LVM5_NEOID|nr:DNA replication ATP-dependent helicase/nuclease dna2 [Neolecta irregularis DAH-3]|eukprot:OLL26694.1 DNA replication ATP-dependent helicase/nuclease dna2 [Neolecta irregularis DAH-3]